MEFIDRKSTMPFILIFFLTCNISALCQSKMADTIVLINIGDYDKGKIATEIMIVNKFNPKVISLDIAFPTYLGDSNDRRLFQALKDCKRLVMPSRIRYQGKDYYDKDVIYVGLTCAMAFFTPQAKAGFVSAKKEDTDTRIPKQFTVWQQSYTEDIYRHFSVVTAMEFDSLKAVNFIQNHERVVDVDYGDGRKFNTFSSSEVLNGKLTKKDIEGKIVMFGYLGPRNNDLFYSLNPNKPVMYGVEYLANIVAQVLESN